MSHVGECWSRAFFWDGVGGDGEDVEGLGVVAEIDDVACINLRGIYSVRNGALYAESVKRVRVGEEAMVDGAKYK